MAIILLIFCLLIASIVDGFVVGRGMMSRTRFRPAALRVGLGSAGTFKGDDDPLPQQQVDPAAIQAQREAQARRSQYGTPSPYLPYAPLCPCAPAACADPTGTACSDIGPPPDLPSLLLANRIIYIGMPIVPSVTELVIAQLLYLNHRSPDQMITLYINSIGTNAPDGKAHYDTEAFAIADTMLFIRPPIRTICVGQAHGTAAMLLALGSKGQRLALPNASILLNQPRTAAQGLSKEVVIRAKEVAANRATTIELLASATGRDVDSVEKDTNRMRYLSPEEAVAYGLIDRVLYPEVIKNKLPDEDEGYRPSFLNFL